MGQTRQNKHILFYEQVVYESVSKTEKKRLLGSKMVIPMLALLVKGRTSVDLSTVQQKYTKENENGFLGLSCCNILARLVTVNLADSMQSQDINKVVSQEKEYNLLPMDRVIDISVRR